MGARNPFREAPKEERTVPRPSLTARSEQTRPKIVPRWIWKPSWFDFEALESPEEMPQSSQKPPARAPKRFQNHLWIANVVFENVEIPFCKTIMFENRRISLGAQNPLREVPKEKKTAPRPSLAARIEQTRPKIIPRWIWKPSWFDLETLESPQGMPQSSQKAPARAPKRFQNHHWIAYIVF